MSLAIDPEHSIRVVVADDSAFMRTAITRMIQSDPQMRVVATAQDGIDALEKIAEWDPDVITLDLEMPRLDGLGVLRRLMPENPKPVIMISSLTQDGAEATLSAFDLGAFDCIPKGSSFATLDILRIREDLILKIRAAAAFKHMLHRLAPGAKHAVTVPPILRSHSHVGPVPSVIAIGTSTGGPRALQEIIPKLPADLSAGVVIVQHMPQGFTGPFARRLDDLSEVTVREAADNEPVQPGTVLVAPATWHMTLTQASAGKYAVRLSKMPENTLHRPSVDVMMLSAAEVCGSHVMGVILTGMGSDGAQGMKAISEKGGRTVGQDESTCAVYGMPRACDELGVLDRVMPLSEIPAEIIHAVSPAAKSSSSGVPAPTLYRDRHSIG
jgi:two-component system chemotaxis response regulator CheB